MLKTVLTVAGKPGLYKLVSSGRNMLIVESVDAAKKRQPVHNTDKVVALGDIAMYTYNEEVALSEVLESVRTKNEGKVVDVKGIGDDADIRAYFETILPDFDQERVYTNDIKKLLNWYNQLIEAGFESFKDIEEAPEEAEPATEEAK